MRPAEHLPPNLEAENARLRQQVADLAERASRLEARQRALADEQGLMGWLASPDLTRYESPAWCAFTGVPPEVFAAGGILAVVHPEDRPRAEAVWQEALRHRLPFQAEFRVRRHDGTYPWLRLRAHPVHGPAEVCEWIGWAHDLEDDGPGARAAIGRAELIEAEVVQRTHALRKSEAMLAESQRLARIGSWELDIATLELTWSEQQFRNFGFEPVGPGISRALAITRLDPRDKERHEAVVRTAIEQGKSFSMDYRVVHPDGTVLHLHSIGQPVFSAEGRVVRMLGTTQDVTERSRLEDQLRSQNAQLMALDELKNNFVNSVTHELRTPLTSIVGYAEFLEDGIGGPITPEQRDFVNHIQRGARRLEYLLNDLLDFARIEAGTFSLRVAPAELGHQIREVVESLRPQAEASRLTVQIQLPESPLELEMDTQRIGQVLTNLLANALKFSRPDGHVSVSAFRQGPRVRCEVRDEGPGITSDELPRLFQRFSQLDAGIRMGKGAGLGLSISKALIDAHGGSLGVDSAPGAGSTFWFELPLHQ